MIEGSVWELNGFANDTILLRSYLTWRELPAKTLFCAALLAQHRRCHFTFPGTSQSFSQSEALLDKSYTTGNKQARNGAKGNKQKLQLNEESRTRASRWLRLSKTCKTAVVLHFRVMSLGTLTCGSGFLDTWSGIVAPHSRSWGFVRTGKRSGVLQVVREPRTYLLVLSSQASF